MKTHYTFRSSHIRLLLFALVILPLLINPVVTLSFDDVYLYPKLWWLYGVILPAAVLVMRVHVTQRLIPAFWWLLALAGWLILGGLAVHHSLFTWYGASDRGDGVFMHIVYIIVALAGLTWAQDRGALAVSLCCAQAFAIGTSLLALTNILQQWGLLGVPGEGAFQGVTATLYGGTLGNRGYMGGALALLLPLIVWALPRCSSQQQRWLGTAIGLITWAWLGSWTRGAWLAGGLSLMWLLVWDPLSRQKIVFKPLIFGALLFSLTAIFGPTEGRNLSFLGHDQTQALTNSSGRGFLWKSAIDGIAQKPLMGWGPPGLWRFMATQPSDILLAGDPTGTGMTDIKVIKRLSQSAEQAPSFLIERPDGKKEIIHLAINKVHNEFLDYALTFGIPAGIIFTILLFSGIKQTMFQVTGLSAALMAYSVYLFTWPEIIRFAPIAWLLLGIALTSISKSR
ncbi:O-antigen ligase family protein [Deinococcus aquaedulcis]|uniref:O-antigen ligase family protein n=1 Tax=Deinococcus aquaedulcis TaxID=2840455 RepID=UPI001C82AE84|nr:O-antigen ligase family protein [Deinococcus aquaedulcis]